jgi:hypothetical protein
MTIDSLTNTSVKYWVSLNQSKNRQESGQFLVEGDHLVRIVVAAIARLGLSWRYRRPNRQRESHKPSGERHGLDQKM